MFMTRERGKLADKKTTFPIGYYCRGSSSSVHTVLVYDNTEPLLRLMHTFFVVFLILNVISGQKSSDGIMTVFLLKDEHSENHTVSRWEPSGRVSEPAANGVE